MEPAGLRRVCPGRSHLRRVCPGRTLLRRVCPGRTLLRRVRPGQTLSCYVIRKMIHEGSVPEKAHLRRVGPGHTHSNWAVTMVHSTSAALVISMCDICTAPADDVCCWGVEFMTTPIVLFGVCCSAFFIISYLCVLLGVFFYY